MTNNNIIIIWENIIGFWGKLNLLSINIRGYNALVNCNSHPTSGKVGTCGAFSFMPNRVTGRGFSSHGLPTLGPWYMAI